MKRLYVTRHAKSSWDNMHITDKERVLNDRGLADAPMMANKCLELGYVPDILISSDATRASMTAEAFRKVFGINELVLDSTLYHAPESSYYEACFGLADNIQSVMLFGHNPGITYLANELTVDFIDNVPTCGVLVIDVDINRWEQIEPKFCTLKDMLFPKNI